MLAIAGTTYYITNTELGYIFMILNIICYYKKMLWIICLSLYLVHMLYIDINLYI